MIQKPGTWQIPTRAAFKGTRTYGIAAVISFDATLSTPLESTLFTT
jgi:hypothetical protein